MPSTADVQAQQAAEARKAREEQERKIYEETQKRIPTEVEPPTPKLETLKASSQTRDAAIAQTARRNAESAARDAGASLSDSVDAGLRAEAEANLQRAAERNRKLNQRVDADTAAKQGGYQFRTLTSVLEEEESNDSGGGSGGGATSGFGGGGGGSSGGGCVIATHGLSTGGFTKLEKAKAEIWCEKKYHNKWYGEAFRRGYRAAGQRCIDRGKAKEHYQEFKDFVAYGRGVKKGFGLGLNYYLRTAQFFITGLFISE
jgi:membrane protein involved in colicin uptake